MVERRRKIPMQRLKAIESRYRHTLRKLNEEMKRPLPDGLKLRNLKKARLALRDQIADLIRPFSERKNVPR